MAVRLITFPIPAEAAVTTAATVPAAATLPFALTFPLTVPVS